MRILTSAAPSPLSCQQHSHVFDSQDKAWGLVSQKTANFIILSQSTAGWV